MCDMPSCFGEEIRKARKSHKCCECRGQIKAGECYTYSHGVWDGAGQSFKTCSDCESLRAELRKDHRLDECDPAFGYIHECVFDLGDEKYKRELESIYIKRGIEIGGFKAVKERTL